MNSKIECILSAHLGIFMVFMVIFGYNEDSKKTLQKIEIISFDRTVNTLERCWSGLTGTTGNRILAFVNH